MAYNKNQLLYVVFPAPLAARTRQVKARNHGSRLTEDTPGRTNNLGHPTPFALPFPLFAISDSN